MTTQPKFSPSIGRTSTENATSESAEVTTSKQSTLFAEDFPAKIFPTPDSGQDLTENEADCSLRRFAWFANCDQEQLCWKTWQRCLLGDWTEYSGRWPRSGLMRNGIAYRLPPLVPRISGTGFSYWVTPTATDGMRGSRPGRPHDTGFPLSQQVVMPHRWPTPDASMGKWVAKKTFPTPTERDWKSGKSKTQAERGRTAGPSLSEVSGGSLSPQWVEWLMGFPLGWTDLEDLETQ